MVLGPIGGKEVFQKRRQEFLKRIKGGVAVLFSHPEQVRNNDVLQPYRQDSCFYYLTGYGEPESVAVFDPSSATPFTMFVRPKDPTKELWDGFRYGVEGVGQYFGVDRVYPIGELKTQLPELLKAAEKIFYRTDEFKENDEIIFGALRTALKSRGRSGMGQADISDAKVVVGEMRLFKDEESHKLLKMACEISAEGHINAMKFCKPGVNEYEVEAELLWSFKRRGSERLGYECIVGSGANATVLHYRSNNAICKDGDILLIDAGCEYGYLSGDITRSFPVNGKFTPMQKKFYQEILNVQKDLINFVKPGIKFTDIHERSIQGLVEGMLSIGLLKGKAKEIIEKKEYIKYFPHGTSHWLGMDVHDCGLYKINGESRRVEPGMCFTIEPGLYVPANDKDAPKELCGTGVRIEDDILITTKGSENLTVKCPKEVDELEEIIGRP